MFVCKKCCETQNRWRFDGDDNFGLSYGRCEKCGKTTGCFDEIDYKFRTPEEAEIHALEECVKKWQENN